MLPRSAEATSLHVVAFASSGPNSGQCKDVFPTCSVTFPGASASASYGSVDGSASASPISGTSGDTSGEADFLDTFTFLNGTGSPTHFEVGFDTAGAR
jgi:hypothetical protein